VDGSNPPTLADHQSNSNAAQEVIAQKMLETPQPTHAEAAREGSVIAKPNVPVENCVAALDAASTLLESAGADGNDIGKF
jgi:hypothetical protein